MDADAVAAFRDAYQLLADAAQRHLDAGLPIPDSDIDVDQFVAEVVAVYRETHTEELTEHDGTYHSH